MPLSIRCPNCGKKSSIAQELIGKHVRCLCGSRFLVGTRDSDRSSYPDASSSNSPSVIDGSAPTPTKPTSSQSESVAAHVSTPSEHSNSEEQLTKDRLAQQRVDRQVRLFFTAFFLTCGILVVALLTLDGAARTRAIGSALVLIVGPLLILVPLGETNPAVKVRNSLMLMPIGALVIIAGLYAVVTGEVPSWFIQFGQDIAASLKK